MTSLPELSTDSIKDNKKRPTSRKMRFAQIMGFLALAGTATAFSLSMSAGSESSVNRRSFVKTTAAGVAAGVSASTMGKPAIAEDDLYADFTTTESGMKVSEFDSQIYQFYLDTW